MLPKYFLLVLLLCFYLANLSTSKITERQYALMPPLFHFDNYDHCMLYGKEALYCSITFQLQAQNLLKPSRTWRIVEKVSSIPKYYRHDRLRHGICIPETCPNITSRFSQNHPNFLLELEVCYNKKYRSKGIIGRITKIRCETKESPYSYKIFDIFFGLFFVLFVTLVFFATCYDLLGQQKSQDNSTKFSKFVSSFSLLENWKRLNNINLENPDVRALRCMQGVRFYSTISVIFGHTTTGNLAIPVANPGYTESLIDRTFVKWIGNGTRYAILQNFFMMSAWLLTYQFFIELEGKKNVSFWYLLRSFIKRYLRLTPTLAIMIGFSASWMVHLSYGPFWNQVVGSEYHLCVKNWWSNLLYLNNYIHGTEMCSGHHWYTAVDTQLYVFGLLLLTVVWYNQNKIVLVLGSFWMFHVIALFLIIYRNNWEYAISMYPELFYDMKIADIDETFVILKSNISNLGSFIVGIAYGYVFYKYRNQKLFSKRNHVILWWILCFGLVAGGAIFPGLMEHLDHFHQNQSLYHAVYGSLGRSVFAIGIGFWMLGVSQGEGSITKDVFEWRPVYVLGRLTYSVFLVHTLIQRFKVGNKRDPNYVDNFTVFFDTIGDVGAAFLGGAFLTLFFEMPISQMTNHVIWARHTKVNKTILDDRKIE